MTPAQVSACLVTRGDVDLTEILDSLTAAGVDDIVIWNNSLEQDLGVYGRYAAIEQARHDRIYVQDDDCVLDPWGFTELCAAYEPGKVVCNMPARFRHSFYEQHALVGFGAVFDRALPDQAFMLYRSWELANGEVEYPALGRTCDVIFTALSTRKLVDVLHKDLPWASAPGRMWTSTGHQEERERMLELALKVRDAPTCAPAATP